MYDTHDNKKMTAEKQDILQPEHTGTSAFCYAI